MLSHVNDEGREYAVSFANRSCNTVERNFNNCDGECLAVVWGVAHCREYLLVHTFTIQTDHRPLKD